jgi:hypothetical protein
MHDAEIDDSLVVSIIDRRTEVLIPVGQKVSRYWSMEPYISQYGSDDVHILYTYTYIHTHRRYVVTSRYSPMCHGII